MTLALELFTVIALMKLFFARLCKKIVIRTRPCRSFSLNGLFPVYAQVYAAARANKLNCDMITAVCRSLLVDAVKLNMLTIKRGIFFDKRIKK